MSDLIERQAHEICDMVQGDFTFDDIARRSNHIAVEVIDGWIAEAKEAAAGPDLGGTELSKTARELATLRRVRALLLGEE